MLGGKNCYGDGGSGVFDTRTGELVGVLDSRRDGRRENESTRSVIWKVRHLVKKLVEDIKKIKSCGIAHDKRLNVFDKSSLSQTQFYGRRLTCVLFEFLTIISTSLVWHCIISVFLALKIRCF